MESWRAFWIIFTASLLGVCTTTSIGERNKFILYFGSNSSEVYNTAHGVDILNSPNFDNSKKTVIYIHGYIESNQSFSVQTVVNAYRQRDDYNIIVVDWHEDASGSYLISALPKCKKLGQYLSTVVFDMVSAGLDLNKLHLVGHSMGGQMVGLIGGGFKESAGGKAAIKRISALDPAFPFFYGPFLNHISKDNAEFVDIIHTDAWVYGAPVSTGTVDFWPNGGSMLQPGCPKRHFIPPLTENDLCSHWRSWHYWSESVAKSDQSKFNAVQAKNWRAFKAGSTGQFNEKIVMGIDCPIGLTGDYYLQTNSESPYARGQAGTTYDPSLTEEIADDAILNTLEY